MSYSHKFEKGFDIIDIGQSIDLYSTPIIKKFIRSLLNSPNRKIILLMEHLRFIDSTGIGMLVSLYFECKQKAIPIRIANMSEDARRILIATTLIESYEIRDTLEDAYKSFE